MQIEQSLLQGFLALYEPLLNSFLDNQCFINQRVYDINSIENMGLDNFKKITEIRKPFKLFKYFNNVYNGECNYSQEALVNNTVFLNKSSSFDDIFDSSININKNSYIELRKEKYLNVLGVQSISDIISVLKNVTLKEDMWLISFFTHSIENALLKTKIEVFLQRLFCNVILNQRINEYEQFFYAALENEYDDYIEQLKNTFGVSCFTTNQFSQLMWSFYANNHKGFCLEYVIDDSFNLEPDYKLLPLIYCRNRPDATSRFVPIMDDTTDNTKLWQLYFHGVLRKGMEWAYQDEWRLLTPVPIKGNGIISKFYPIKRIYLGARMEKEEKKKLYEICNEKNIEVRCMVIDPRQYKIIECQNSIKSEIFY